MQKYDLDALPVVNVSEPGGVIRVHPAVTRRTINTEHSNLQLKQDNLEHLSADLKGYITIVSVNSNFHLN